jgi:branched-chain amino acid transport system permease protein
MDRTLQAIADAVSSGSLYALIALGIALIFGVMRLINIAYGETVVATIYIAYFLRDQPPVVVIGAMVLTGIVLSVVIERLAFSPLRNASPTTMLIAAFAVSFILQNAALATVGASPRSAPAGSSLATAQSIGPVEVPGYSIVTVLAVAVIVLALRAFLVRSTLGIGMRAASEDFNAARLLGVRANSVIRIAFVLSGVIAAVVGYLLVSATGVVTPTSGTTPALLGFIAVVIGGMGSLPAAAGGGFLLGAVTQILQYVLPNDALVFRDALLFSGVLLLLIWRPQGLFINASNVQERA